LRQVRAVEGEEMNQIQETDIYRKVTQGDDARALYIAQTMINAMKNEMLRQRDQIEQLQAERRRMMPILQMAYKFSLNIPGMRQLFNDLALVISEPITGDTTPVGQR
jgi:hypothetical protein